MEEDHVAEGIDGEQGAGGGSTGGQGQLAATQLAVPEDLGEQVLRTGDDVHPRERLLQPGPRTVVDPAREDGESQDPVGLPSQQSLDLAQQVVRDGEGATKLVEISVTGAASDADAHKHAKSIANSPLVKTAIAGEDPNWGRIVMAVGKSGARADRDTLAIWFGDIKVAEGGWVSPDYSEDAAAAYMKGQELIIHVDLGLGGGTARVWTCDLSHGYIDINADYRS